MPTVQPIIDRNMRSAIMRTLRWHQAATVAALVSFACGPDQPAPEGVPEIAFEVTTGTPLAGDPREVHLKNIRQLTTEGENAEAYFSFDGKKLSFQRTGAGGGCDQIYTLDLATGDTTRISDGTGRTTCAYFYPAGDRVLYASTHKGDATCPAKPDFSRGYVWPVYPTYEIFVADLLHLNGEGYKLLVAAVRPFVPKTK